MELYRLALARKIMIAPGRVFSLRDRFESCFRLNAGVWEPGTDAKIRELGSLARGLPSGERHGIPETEVTA
jgi:DNA-binding transcriptional MocR family regulator